MARTDLKGRRSGGAPSDYGTKVITDLIDARTQSVVVTRPTKTTGSLDETTETTAEHTEQIWFVSPRKSVTNVDTGERVNGDLRGLAPDPLDIQKDDRITYGGVEYEVDTVIGRPGDGTPDGETTEGVDYFVITLVRRQ